MNQPSIEVSIIAVTSGEVVGMSPEDVLIYTKSTRLEQCKDSRTKVMLLAPKEREEQLAYMASTIPSSWEFIDYVFEIRNVTRAFTHQFVRTRAGSYAQQTMRMLNKKEFTYRIPPRLMKKGKELERKIYEKGMADIQSVYDSLIAYGCEVEDARGLLPTNIHTNIIAKFNLRTLSEMAKSRTGARTQDEYREVMDLMLNAVVALHPWSKQFLFPEVGQHAKSLEELLKRIDAFGELPPQERTAAFKHLDALRKGES